MRLALRAPPEQIRAVSRTNVGWLFACLLLACGGPPPARTGGTASETAEPDVETNEDPAAELAEASHTLVSALEAEVHITAFVSRDLPPPYDETAEHTLALVEAYRRAGAGRVVVHVPDVGTDEFVVLSEEAGVPEVSHPVIENDSMQVRQGYRGVLIRCGERQHVIPVLDRPDRIEYQISAAIHHLTRPPARIGIVTGHGSPTPEDGLVTLAQLLEHTELVPVAAAGPYPDDLAAILIVDPSEALEEAELRAIDAYVGRGRALGVFGGSVHVTMEGPAPSATPVDTGINRLLDAWGIELGDQLVADRRCGRVPMRTPLGMMIPVFYPPAPIVPPEEVEGSPLRGGGQLGLFFTTAIDTRAPFAELGGQVLLRSSAESWLLPSETPLAPRDPGDWEVTGTPRPYALAVSLHGPLPSAFGAARAEPQRSRVLVVGSGSNPQDPFLPNNPATGPTTTERALVDLIAWLIEDERLLALRTLRPEL